MLKKSLILGIFILLLLTGCANDESAESGIFRGVVNDIDPLDEEATGEMPELEISPEHALDIATAVVNSVWGETYSEDQRYRIIEIEPLSLYDVAKFPTEIVSDGYYPSVVISKNDGKIVQVYREW